MEKENGECEYENENLKNMKGKGGGGGIPLHGGKYVRYHILGSFFDVYAKYAPPIQPVGRGAYGIVCCATNAETKEGVAIKKGTAH